MAHFLITPHAYATLHTVAHQVHTVCDRVSSDDLQVGLEPLLDPSCVIKLSRKSANFLEDLKEELNQNIRLPNTGWNDWTPEGLASLYRVLRRLDCLDRRGCSGTLDFDGKIAAIPINTARKPLNLRQTVPSEQGIASYYGTGDSFGYRQTAYGLIHDPHLFTLAHKTLPPGTVVEVIYHNRKTGIERRALAVVTDKGPYVGERKADLSPALFAYLLGHRTLPKQNPGLLPVTLRIPTLSAPAIARALTHATPAPQKRLTLLHRLSKWLSI